jgi:uncharacterized protein (DUF1697 family)
MAGSRQIVLLRGINIGARNRIAMPALREALEEAGYEDVATYVQSGNVVMSSERKPDELARRCGQLIAERFDLDIPVVVRTRAELARVVRRDPLGDVADDPKRYQVTFLAQKPKAALVRELEALAAPNERLAVAGREIYAWHPDGAARSKLWNRLAGRDLGVTATARNWNTVTALLALADD